MKGQVKIFAVTRPQLPGTDAPVHHDVCRLSPSRSVGATAALDTLRYHTAQQK